MFTNKVHDALSFDAIVDNGVFTPLSTIRAIYIYVYIPTVTEDYVRNNVAAYLYYSTKYIYKLYNIFIFAVILC